METRRVSEDFQGFLANASGYQNPSFKNRYTLYTLNRSIELGVYISVICQMADS